MCSHQRMTVVLPLKGRDCGKALTLPLKLVGDMLLGVANGLSLTANQF